MAESVEMRVPFLDRELVEFVESLPTGFKLRRGMRKAVHKRAMTGLLPRAIVHRKERGFNTPVGAWFRHELHDEVRGMLLAPNGLSASLFERQYLERLLQSHRDATADHTRQLFCLFSLELWAQRFLGELPAVDISPRRRLGELA
jgi:asparagine synthase (glutamine-hydrolysing)